MENLLIIYPKCTTCIKAKKWLDDNNIDYGIRDISANVPTKDELREWINLSGKDVKKWFNTCGLKYKELGLKDKLLKFSEDEKIDLLSSDGMLIKRPILLYGHKVLVGFKLEEWEDVVI